MGRMILTFLTLTVIAPFLLGSCDTKTKTVDSCGDGFLDPGEACDGSEMTATTCMELGYYDQQGILTCKSDCTFDLSVCTGGRCGDGTIQGINLEKCDGENLDDQTCETQGLGGGTLTCKDTCRFDVSRCELSAVCGDDMAASPFEPCDGTDLDGQTCVSQGFYRGVLACDTECTGFDTTGCTNCGNGAVDDGETCDGTNLDGKTCVTQGYASGALACNPNCSFNTTGYLKAFAGSTGSNAIGAYAVFGYSTSETGRTTTQRSNPVGSKLQNELGFHDLSGNVWEWAWDWYAASYPTGTLTDTRGPASGAGRVRRGGGWSGNASYCTVAYRDYVSPGNRDGSIGFRVSRP